MALKCKLGQLIEQVERRNSELEFGADAVRGISNTKQIQMTKADISNRSFKKFQIVKDREFVYNRRTTRMGEKIGLGFNDVGYDFIVTEDYTVFKVKDYSVLLPEYLFIFFNRPEFDRYSRWDSWGSATEFFNWPEMIDVDIIVPPLEIQERYVAVYKSLIANQQCYENGLEGLKLVCDATIEKFRSEMKSEAIGSYIIEVNNKNIDKEVTLVQGVESSGQFMPTKAKMEGIDISKYNIVEVDDIVYNPSRINIGSVAISTQRCIVSPMYEVFRVVDTKKLLPQYLMMWLGRKETQRYTLFKAMGSVRDTFDFGLMKEYEIPIPDISLQKSIVDIYNTYITRRELNKRLKSQIKDICPILISGAVKETRTNVQF